MSFKLAHKALSLWVGGRVWCRCKQPPTSLFRAAPTETSPTKNLPASARWLRFCFLELFAGISPGFHSCFQGDLTRKSPRWHLQMWIPPHTAAFHFPKTQPWLRLCSSSSDKRGGKRLGWSLGSNFSEKNGFILINNYRAALISTAELPGSIITPHKNWAHPDTHH